MKINIKEENRNGVIVQHVEVERPIMDRVENLIGKTKEKYEDISEKLYEKFGIII